MTNGRGLRASVLAFALTAILTVSSATGGQASSSIGDAGGNIDWIRLGLDVAAPMRPILDAIDGPPGPQQG